MCLHDQVSASPGAALSPSAIIRLTARWQDEARAFAGGDLVRQ